MRGVKQVVKCKRCKCEFEARIADIRRGWGKFCSKSCKASEQENRTGQYTNYLGSGVDRETYLEHAREYGGVPQFHHRTGNYEGFRCTGFSNEE